MNNLCHFRKHSNFTALTKITKPIRAINELSLSIYLSMPRTKTNLVRAEVILVSLGTQMDFGGNSLKLFRTISVMIINKMQIEQR